jgi:nicotinate-nucleotide pyrophosphorylase (carboxylating)
VTETLPLRQSTVDALVAAGLDPTYVAEVVVRAIAEDLAGGVDVTSVAAIPAGRVDSADVVARAAGVLAGLAVAVAVFDVVGAAAAAGQADPAGERSGDRASSVEASALARDGARVHRGEVVLTVRGPTRALLTAERSALNLLCHLSGVATATRSWVDAVAGTSAQIRDTRKTTPGLRALEKYAVRCGGGTNHRMSLSDTALVKDNHVMAAGGVAAAFAAVRTRFPGVPVEVECDSLEDVAAAVDAGADLILLDNMSTVDIRAAVRLAHPRGVRLEASGGLTLERAGEVAATGVDYLSVGALTHSAPALDLALDLRQPAREPQGRAGAPAAEG